MNKTNKMLTGIISAAMITASGCTANESLPPIPEGTDCDDWEWEADEGVWECDDHDSPHFGYFFYAGKLFSSKSRLHANSAYQKYRSGGSFKGGSSGFGSGSPGGFGG